MPPFGASQNIGLGFLKIDFSDAGEIENFGVLGGPLIRFWEYFEFAERVAKFNQTFR